MAASLNLTTFCGEAFALRITLEGEGTIAGWTFQFTMKKRPRDEVEIVEKTSGSGITITDAANRVVELVLDSTDTLDVTPGQYVYDFWRVDPGEEAPALGGTWALKSSVTRPGD